MSMTFTLEKADQRFGARWRWEAVAGKWAIESGATLTAAIRREAPVGTKPGSGRLRESITAHPKVSASAVSVEFKSSVPYAKYVVEGTPAHVIMPRNARMLRWESSGQVFYRSMVNHPGAKPNRFPERAVRPLVPAVMGKMRNLIIESMGSL